MTKISFDLDEDFTAWFGDEVWIRHESIMSVLTHMNLQSCNVNSITQHSYLQVCIAVE